MNVRTYKSEQSENTDPIRIYYALLVTPLIIVIFVLILAMSVPTEVL